MYTLGPPDRLEKMDIDPNGDVALGILSGSNLQPSDVVVAIIRADVHVTALDQGRGGVEGGGTMPRTRVAKAPGAGVHARAAPAYVSYGRAH